MTALFILMQIGSLLPPRLIDPDWQMALAGNLIDNGAYPLLGLLLVMLASSLNPNDAVLQQRSARLRGLACWAAVGYLLLVPLEGLAIQRGINLATLTLNRDTRNARRAIGELRSVITRSGSFAELQGRFRQLQAPALPPDAASLPLGDLKGSLLDRLKTNEQALEANLRQPLIGRFAPILQKGLRHSLMSLVLCIGFAAVASPRGGSISLLEGCWGGISDLRRRLAWQRDRLAEWREDARSRREMRQRMAAVQRARRHTDSKPGGSRDWRAWGKRRSSIHDQDYFDRISGQDKGKS